MQVEDNNAFINNLAECKYRVTGMIEMTVIGFLSLRCVGEPDAELRLHGTTVRRHEGHDGTTGSSAEIASLALVK